MRAKSFADMNCSIAGTLELVGDRWGFLLLRDMMLGLSRYDQFLASSGIPPQTLSLRLQHLEASGLILRDRYQERPARHAYLLTQKGQDMWMVLTAMREWGDRWAAHGSGAPPVELVEEQGSLPLELALIHPASGEQVPLRRAVARAGAGADERTRFRLSGGRTA